jgi:hypothetical protein
MPGIVTDLFSPAPFGEHPWQPMRLLPKTLTAPIERLGAAAHRVYKLRHYRPLTAAAHRRLAKVA